MKIFLLLFLLASSIYYLGSPSPISAQGTCTCTYNVSFRKCDYPTNTCSVNFIPQCSNVPQSGGYVCGSPTCTCEPAPPSFICGTTSRECCPWDPPCNPDLFCVPVSATGQNLCLGQASCDLLPGGCPLNSGPFCGLFGNNLPEVRSALGCIPYEAKPFVTTVLQWSVGVGSGITFILIVYGSFLWITGGGDPKKIQAGQELITAALAGLATIVLSVLLVNAIGDTILRLGPLGFNV